MDIQNGDNLMVPNSTHVDTFRIFWAEYPRHEMKGNAFKVWKKNNIYTYLPEILSFIRRAKRTKSWLDGYILQPANFLSGERWNDNLKYYDAGKKENTFKVYKSNRPADYYDEGIIRLD